MQKHIYFLNSAQKIDFKYMIEIWKLRIWFTPLFITNEALLTRVTDEIIFLVQHLCQFLFQKFPT